VKLNAKSTYEISMKSPEKKWWKTRRRGEGKSYK